MAAAAAGDDSAVHEELLWSLGVGSTLPQWLKDLRAQERGQGMNEGARDHREPPTRPGMGPQRTWNDGREQAAPSSQPAPPAQVNPPTYAAQSTQSPYPATPAASTSSSSVPAVAASARGSSGNAVRQAAPHESAAKAPERKTNPHDGQVYTLQEMLDKYRSMFAEADITAYFHNECKPLQVGAGAGAGTRADADRAAAAAAPATPVVPVPAPSAAAPSTGQEISQVAKAKKFNFSIKEWLQSMDDSGFLTQYHDGIASKLDSLDQIVDVYAKSSGEVDAQFFVDVGIKKLGHKRLFEKWFRDNCGA